MDFFTLQRLREQEEQQAHAEQSQQKKQTTYPPVHETKLVNTEINDNHGVVVSGGSNKITIVMGKNGIETIESEPIEPIPETKSNYPRENDYISVAQWLDEQKQLGIDYFKEAGGNRAQLCRNLTKLFHWVVDPNSLGKQMRNYDFT